MDFCSKKYSARESKKRSRKDKYCLSSTQDEAQSPKTFKAKANINVKSIKPLLLALEQLGIKVTVSSTDNQRITLIAGNNKILIEVGEINDSLAHLKVLDSSTGKQTKEIFFRFTYGAPGSECTCYYYCKLYNTVVSFQILEEKIVQQYNITTLTALHYYNTPARIRNSINEFSFCEDAKEYRRGPTTAFMDYVHSNGYNARKYFRRYHLSLQERGNIVEFHGREHKLLNNCWWEIVPANNETTNIIQLIPVPDSSKQ